MQDNHYLCLSIIVKTYSLTMSDSLQENNPKTLKEKLKLVFDDDLRTKLPIWKNWVDYLIIGLIIVSTVAVFLSTFDMLKKYSSVLRIIEVVTIVCFTIEISLRIWVADLVDKRYEGFWGRVRYCLSFYGLIDLISVVPFYINLFLPTPSAALRVMRVFRFMRLFSYMKSSRLLFNAISSKKNELIISLSFLTLFTVVLSVLLYFVEHEAQPERCENGWQTFVWAFAKYLGDPGKIADFTLETPAANFIAFIVGILGVAIFAVPTGIISSGITEALEDDKKEKELEDYHNRLHKMFRRNVDITLRNYLSQNGKDPAQKMLYFTPQRIPMARILLHQGIEMKDVFNVCKKYSDFRVKNLAEALSSENQVDDRFVLEHFPMNRSYGYCKNRKSKVTIVSTSSGSDNGTGWFTYYLAKMGGFNYISKDVEVDSDEIDSFFNMSEEPLFEGKPESYYKDNMELDKKKREMAINIIKRKEANRRDFLADLSTLATGGDSWVILFVAQVKNSQNPIDFHFSEAKRDDSDHTVTLQDTYKQLCLKLSQMLEKKYELTSSLKSERFPTTKNFLGYKLKEKGILCNCFLLRPSTYIINFDNRRHTIAYRMAEVISKILDNGKGVDTEDKEDFQTRSFGYTDSSNNKQ